MNSEETGSSEQSANSAEPHQQQRQSMKENHMTTKPSVRRLVVASTALLAFMTGSCASADTLDPLLEPLESESDLGGEDTAAVDHSAHSLYHGPEPRPGPDILYAAPPRAPQLENSGVWKAQPILISGASAYRRGEFLYQDFLYDDHGADGGAKDPNDPRRTGHSSSGANGTYTYPTDPVYASNAADFVELRVNALNKETRLRVTVNTLLDPAKVAFTVALGSSALPREFPFGANVRAPAQLFLTVQGNTAVLHDAATGSAIHPTPVVSVDMERRQFDIAIPHDSWNPGDQAVRIAAGIGLWDQVNDRYLLPGESATESEPGGAGYLTSPAAFFNVAFRYDEAFEPWRDLGQGEALADNDISRFYTVVDFAKLKSNTTDEMLGQPHGTPQYGPMNRILASHFETKQGADWNSDCGEASGCIGMLRGQLQPYAVYVPDKPLPSEGYGLTLLLHSLGANYNQYLGDRNQWQFGERGRGHIVITPAGRGPDGWYVDHAAADTFEVWADVARHYKLDPGMVSVSGYSMGGHGTFKFASRYPDLFAKAFTTVGPPALGIWAPPAEPTGGDSTNTYHLLEGLRNVPILMWVQAADELVPYTGTREQAMKLDALNYRYRFDTFLNGEHLTLAIHDQYAPAAEFLGDARVDRDPHHISYVVNPAMDFPNVRKPGVGVVADHAYWLSGMVVRDDTVDGGRGSIDAISHGFGRGDAPASETQTGAGAIEGNLGLQSYTSEYKTWGLTTVQAEANRLDLTVRNIAAITVHPTRAKLGCDAALHVDTDGPLTVTLAGCNRTVSYP
jgi:pimeloyl-ACP methyl ester carboxylesterase